MAFLENQLIVKKSKLPAAGKGLFTQKLIKKGTRIVEYKGRIRTWKEVTEDPGFNAYVFYITRNRVIDARRTVKALGRYANDARGLTKIKGLLNNSKYTTEDGHVYIDAVKDIAAGSEIFVSYGNEYWEVVKFNMKSEE